MACGDRSRAKPPDPTPSITRDAATLAVGGPSGSQSDVVIDMTSPLSSCVFGHHGIVLDVGVRTSAPELGRKLVAPPVDWIEREGASFVQAHGKSVSVAFFMVPPADVTAEGPANAMPFVEARVRGGAARTLSFFLNGRALGAVNVPRGETKVVSLKGPLAEPVPGANELTIRFSGVPKASTDPALELDWVHFGAGDPDPTFSAPTWKEVLVSRSFGGQPARALSLRGPGFARCEGWIPSGSVVETRAMLEGTGAADAEVRVIRDRTPPTVIGTMHLDGTDTRPRVHTWPVGDIGLVGTFGAVELSVVRATKGTRVVFGEPRVTVAREAATKTADAQARAKGIVLVIFSQLGAHSLAAYGGSLAAPAIAGLASSGLIFENSRATTAISNGAVGAMLTGMPAEVLGMTDGDARLPKAATTVADAVRQAGIASAFFTANPLTSAAFGFDRGWAHFESHLPTEDGAATRVFDAATAWLEAEHRDSFLLVVHARGGHPPWDISPERLRALPPEGYTGGLDPRHAGELFGHSLKNGAFRFDDRDRARASALYAAAMDDEDAALSHLLETLKALGLEDTTTVILNADVGQSESARVPFAESDSLDEGGLMTPLIVRWAHDRRAGAHAAVAAGSEDIGTTILASLGLPLPVTFRGRDLRKETDAPGAFSVHPLLAAVKDRFSLRWGPFVSTGVRDHETKLCDLSLEAACVTDVRESYPLASRVLHATLFHDLVVDKPAYPREPASLDVPLQAALKAWGR
jgi:arylsulfatase A-like enzyme